MPEAKPILLSVDDDPQVLRAIRRDLRNHYKDDYRVLSADSGAAALELLRELKQRGDNVALMLSDQRMPEMDGTHFLARAAKVYPQAKRILLTAYSDIDAAVQAINDVGLDYYLTKPWDPPVERLYPVLDDHLADWQQTYRPELRGIRVLGYRNDPRSHAIKDFLAGNQVPYAYVDVRTSAETSEEVLATAQLSESKVRYPLCVLEDGSVLQQPEVRDLAAAIGMHTDAQHELYDVAIVGAGPSGLAAAVYGGSEGLKTVIVERRAPGGQAGTSSRIENYLGFPNGISGSDLSRRALTQVQRFGVELLAPKAVTAIEPGEVAHTVRFEDETSLRTRAVVVTTGVAYRELPAAGAERFSGAGVYYGAATTEAQGCTDQHVIVVGGGNSAGQGAVYLSRFARQVTIYIRKPDLTTSMSSYLIDQIGGIENIAVEGYREIREVLGGERLEAVAVERLDDGRAGECYRQEADAVFVFIGAHPHTDWLDGTVARTDRGYVLTGAEVRALPEYGRVWKRDREPFLLETSTPGIFAAGDVRAGAMNRVASAVGEGSMAIKFVHEYMAEV